MFCKKGCQYYHRVEKQLVRHTIGNNIVEFDAKICYNPCVVCSPMDALGALISVTVITIKLWIYTIPQPAIAWYSDQQISNMRPMSTICAAAYLILGTKATWFQVDGNMVIKARTLFNTPAAWCGVVVAERLVLREDVPPSDMAVVQCQSESIFLQFSL
jgi:hypothetical protein